MDSTGAVAEFGAIGRVCHRDAPATLGTFSPLWLVVLLRIYGIINYVQLCDGVPLVIFKHVHKEDVPNRCIGRWWPDGVLSHKYTGLCPSRMLHLELVVDSKKTRIGMLPNAATSLSSSITLQITTPNPFSSLRIRAPFNHSQATNNIALIQ
jgi:hypothetical protein